MYFVVQNLGESEYPVQNSYSTGYCTHYYFPVYKTHVHTKVVVVHTTTTSTPINVERNRESDCAVPWRVPRAPGNVVCILQLDHRRLYWLPRSHTQPNHRATRSARQVADPDAPVSVSGSVVCRHVLWAMPFFFFFFFFTTDCIGQWLRQLEHGRAAEQCTHVCASV